MGVAEGGLTVVGGERGLRGYGLDTRPLGAVHRVPVHWVEFSSHKPARVFDCGWLRSSGRQVPPVCETRRACRSRTLRMKGGVGQPRAPK